LRQTDRGRRFVNADDKVTDLEESVRRIVSAAAVALPLLFAAPGVAHANDTLASGTTTLKLDAGVAKALKSAGVKVSGTRYKITGGSLDGATGTIRHSGTLRLRAGARSLSASAFTVKLGKSSTLSGRVGKARVTLLKLDTSRAKIARNGLDYRITGVRVALTAAAAKALNATFHTTLFKTGLRLGTVAVTAKPKTIGLTGGATTVTLDQGAANALQSLGISAAPIGSDSLAFPITGGKLDAKTFAGTIRHSGGIALTKGSTTVQLTDFEIGIDDTPELTALVGGSRVPILSVDLSGLKSDVSDGTITLTGAALKLTAPAAGALNQAFGTTAFTEGLLLGTAAVRANPPTARAASARTYGATTLKLDAGAVAALTGLGVAPAPIAPATALANGELAFPITNAPFAALLSGSIRHSGGISLTAGTTTVRLENFIIDPLRRQLTATVNGGARVPILDLSFATARIYLGGRALNIGPVGGALTGVAAGALDGAFGLPAGTVPPGLKLGDATVRYRLF
jgi:hypothetical protein